MRWSCAGVYLKSTRSAKQGDNTQVKFSFKPTYYRLVWNGADLIEIDVVNMVEKWTVLTVCQNNAPLSGCNRNNIND